MERVKVYAVCAHGVFTDQWGVTENLQYGHPYDEKLFYKKDDAVNFREEIVGEWNEEWVERNRINDSVYMIPRNHKYEKDVIIFSIVEFQLD